MTVPPSDAPAQTVRLYDFSLQICFYEPHSRQSLVVILYILHRGAHGREQKFVHAAGIPVFFQQDIAQMVETMDDNTILSGSEVYLKFPFLHRAFLLYAFIISGPKPETQMCESIYLNRNGGNSG